VSEKRRGAHRPSRLTKEVFESVEKALKLGAFRKTAALWSGISYSTFLEWMRFGKERPESEYGKFRSMVIRTETDTEVFVGGTVLAASRHNPKLALDWLRVRHRKRWNERQQVELSGPKGGPIQTEQRRDLKDLSDEELETLRRLLARGANAGGGGRGAGET
jgi:hypothetical protein